MSIPIVRADNGPASDWDKTVRRIRVPILMYHYVSNLPPDADATRVNLTVAPAMFRSQMQYLKDNGYHTISLYQLYDALMKGAPLPKKPIVLTFDDGYIDMYSNVFPMLKEFGFTGTFFIITAPVDENNTAYVTWGELRQMAGAGMSIEAHTKHHQDLRNRKEDYLTDEIQGSVDEIAAHIGQVPRMLAYPSGRYDTETLRVTRKLPVWMAVTTRRGALQVSNRLLELPRVRISGDTGMPGFESLLRMN
jgi:peptidoglycan/xylan/chitin deacetylase (PgdA/CDA1 family)